MERETQQKYHLVNYKINIEKIGSIKPSYLQWCLEGINIALFFLFSFEVFCFIH